MIRKLSFGSTPRKKFLDRRMYRVFSETYFNNTIGIENRIRSVLIHPYHVLHCSCTSKKKYIMHWESLALIFNNFNFCKGNFILVRGVYYYPLFNYIKFDLIYSIGPFWCQHFEEHWQIWWIKYRGVHWVTAGPGMFYWRNREDIAKKS